MPGNKAAQNWESRKPEASLHMKGPHSCGNAGSASYGLKAGHALAARTLSIAQCRGNRLPLIDTVDGANRSQHMKISSLKKDSIRLIRLKERSGERAYFRVVNIENCSRLEMSWPWRVARRITHAVDQSS